MNEKIENLILLSGNTNNIDDFKELFFDCLAEISSSSNLEEVKMLRMVLNAQETYLQSLIFKESGNLQ